MKLFLTPASNKIDVTYMLECDCPEPEYRLIDYKNIENEMNKFEQEHDNGTGAKHNISYTAHKNEIYTPLFIPLAIAPVIMSLIGYENIVHDVHKRLAPLIDPHRVLSKIDDAIASLPDIIVSSNEENKQHAINEFTEIFSKISEIANNSIKDKALILGGFI